MSLEFLFFVIAVCAVLFTASHLYCDWIVRREIRLGVRK